MFSFSIADFKFAIYPPSMIAAASVSAATHGLMGHSWSGAERTSLLDRLHKITAIDVVSIFTSIFIFQHQSLCNFPKIKVNECYVENSGRQGLLSMKRLGPQSVLNNFKCNFKQSFAQRDFILIRCLRSHEL